MCVTTACQIAMSDDKINTDDLIEGHDPSDVETGEKYLESPLTGNKYRVTKWVDQGDGKFIAIEKELVNDE